MTTCEDGYLLAQTNSRYPTSALKRATHSLIEFIAAARLDYQTLKRRRATERALDGLSESIRCDIGWPDLYERQAEPRKSAREG